jgi:hypothetical protein
MSAHATTWTCPCGEAYALRAEVGRPVFRTTGATRPRRVAHCTNPACRRDLRKTRAEMRYGVQQELRAA